MNNKMEKRVLGFLISLLSLSLSSQNFKTSLKMLEDKNQNCLDKGHFMHNCASVFYKQSDSLLNVVYRHIQNNLILPEKESLKKEQLIWLKQRNKKFNQIDTIKTNLGRGLDDLMVKKDKKAFFINERTIYLIEKFLEEKFNTVSFEKISESLDESFVPIICQFLKIEEKSIDKSKSSSLNYNNKNIFYAITSESGRDDECGTYFETSFLLVNTELKKVVNHLEYSDLSYCEREAWQPDKAEISSNLINLGLENDIIAIKYLISVGGCANSYSSDNLVLLLPKGNSFKEILKPFHLNRIIHQGGCNGNYSLERQKSVIKIIPSKENKYSLKISTKIKYEVNVESNLDKNEQKNYSEKTKNIVRLVHINENNKYEIDELPYFFFEN